MLNDLALGYLPLCLRDQGKVITATFHSFLLYTIKQNNDL